jgi:hypothetical protein
VTALVTAFASPNFRARGNPPATRETCRMTCGSVSMLSLAIWSPTESACGDELTDKSRFIGTVAAYQFGDG